jgi:8-oxo-dGTP diphosphatase
MRTAPLVRGAFTMLKEVARHILRRPVVGIAAAAHTSDGRWLLIRRVDVDEWALVGGTLEWGETLRTCIARELAEEAGVLRCEILRVVGVYSDPGRDPRFHAVTVVVDCLVDPPQRPPANALEIAGARLFTPEELPARLGMNMRDMLRAAMAGDPPVLE